MRYHKMQLLLITIIICFILTRSISKQLLLISLKIQNIIEIWIIIEFKIFENVEIEQLSFSPHLETVILGFFLLQAQTTLPLWTSQLLSLITFITDVGQITSRTAASQKLQDKRILNFGVLKSNI